MDDMMRCLANRGEGNFFCYKLIYIYNVKFNPANKKIDQLVTLQGIPSLSNIFP